eukprot:g1481.t1
MQAANGVEEPLLPRNFSAPQLTHEYGAISDRIIASERIHAKYDWSVAAVVFVIDLCIVVAVFLVNHLFPSPPVVDPRSAIGWVATLGAVFIFGSFGVLIKTKEVQEAAVHSLVFQLYYAAGVAVSSMAIWGSSREPLCVSAWGITFAICWIGSQFFAYSAISSIGYAVGPAVWGGVTILSIAGAVGALIVLVIGICLAASTQSSFPKILAARCQALMQRWQKSDDGGSRRRSASDGRPRSNSLAGRFSGSNHTSPLKQRLLQRTSSYKGDETTDIAKMVQTASGRTHAVRGLLAAIASGLFNGSMTMPLRCFPSNCKSVPEVLSYKWGRCEEIQNPPMAFLPSCAAGIAVMVPLFFLLFFGLRNLVELNYRWRDLSIPGFFTGAFWAMGNFSAFFSTQHLGQTIGYPLTQTCVIVSGLWGIFYYREIEGPGIGLFFVAVAVILAGAALNGLYG